VVVVPIVIAIMVPVVVMIMVVAMVMIVLMLIRMFAIAIEVALALFLVAMLPLTPLLLLVMHVMRRVDILIPTVGDEVDRPIAGVVFLAMPRPVPFMSGRDVEVQGLGRCYTHDHRRGDHDRRLWEEQLGRGQAAANGDLSVHAGRTDIHSNTHVAGQRGGG
jgi:hypothetical protein